MDTLITKAEAVRLLEERQKLIQECSAYGGEDNIVGRLEEIDDIIATFCFKNFLAKKMTREEIMPFLGIIFTKD